MRNIDGTFGLSVDVIRQINKLIRQNIYLKKTKIQ
jgi:hypothetical protein